MLQVLAASEWSMWCRPCSVNWWEEVQSGRYGDMWWKENLRMSQTTFDILCRELRLHIERQSTYWRQPISVEKRVAVTLWKLATNAEYRTLSALFGIGRSTVCVTVIETCNAIAKHLFPRYVYFPTGDRLRDIVTNFETCWEFPQAAGAIDGTHIPVIRPTESASDYYNRKGYYSIIMQAVVDFRGWFMDAYIGWPGKVHDARVLVNSSLYRKAMSGTLLPDWKRTIFGVQVPLVILGDPAYPALPWLMKPYPENARSTVEKRRLNYRQIRAWMPIENAFGRLKGRWRCLLKRMDCNLSNVPNVVASCVVLHNMCEMYGDHCDNEWIHHEESSRMQAANHHYISAGANDIRNAIKDFVNN